MNKKRDTDKPRQVEPQVQRMIDCGDMEKVCKAISAAYLLSSEQDTLVAQAQDIMRRHGIRHPYINIHFSSYSRAFDRWNRTVIDMVPGAERTRMIKDYEEIDRIIQGYVYEGRVITSYDPNGKGPTERRNKFEERMRAGETPQDIEREIAMAAKAVGEYPSIRRTHAEMLDDMAWLHNRAERERDQRDEQGRDGATNGRAHESAAGRTRQALGLEQARITNKKN